MRINRTLTEPTKAPGIITPQASSRAASHTSTPAPDALFVSVEVFARKVGVGLTTAWGLVSRGEVPSITLGKRRLIPVSYLDSLTSAVR